MENSILRSCDLVKDLKEKTRISCSSLAENSIQLDVMLQRTNMIFKHINENVSNRRKESFY